MILVDVFIFHGTAAALAAARQTEKNDFSAELRFSIVFADSRTSHIRTRCFTSCAERLSMRSWDVWNCKCMSRRRLFDGRQQQQRRAFFRAFHFLLSAHFVSNIQLRGVLAVLCFSAYFDCFATQRVAGYSYNFNFVGCRFAIYWRHTLNGQRFVCLCFYMVGLSTRRIGFIVHRNAHSFLLCRFSRYFRVFCARPPVDKKCTFCVRSETSTQCGTVYVRRVLNASGSAYLHRLSPGTRNPNSFHGGDSFWPTT